jgi:hypothetical protein
VTGLAPGVVGVSVIRPKYWPSASPVPSIVMDSVIDWFFFTVNELGDTEMLAPAGASVLTE